jgi:peptidoglycan/xylan/chitin deacetylase (PgdA/CDA1 family)
MSKQQKSLIKQAEDSAGKYGGFSFGGQEPYGVKPYNQMKVGTIFPNGAKTAILLTFDVEGNYGNGTGNQGKEIVNYKRICSKLSLYNIPATFNVVGKMAEEHGSEFIGWMFDAGCEVAPHGYWHDLDRVFEEKKVYAGHYGYDENLSQIRLGVVAINKFKQDSVKGIRLPYAHFNEYSYQVMEELGLEWASHVGIDDFVVPGQGFGGMPFQMRLGDKKYDIVEIPLDSQTYDWSIWVADEKANRTFVDAVRSYCNSRNLDFDRTPGSAVKIWKQRIADTIEQQSVFTLLCHPINLTVESDKWTDAVDEFLFPVIEYIGQLVKENKIWVCTCNELADFYKQEIK